MTKIFNEKLGETLYQYKHSTGLTILVLPKADYSKIYAVYATKYGSIDNHFEALGTEQKVPDGIAHFLEHKLFESEDGNAFDKYAKTGASANAYTSFDKTAYLFSCSDNFAQSLEILLSFVNEPYFSKESVQKEQGIISQEISMYNDDPGWRAFFNLLTVMYHNSNVKIDIAGTSESISKITPDLLYSCYNTFYNPSNMVLCICGNVDVNEVARIADKVLKPKQIVDIKDISEEEPDNVVKAEISQKLSVAIPVFNIGVKDNGYFDCKDILKRKKEFEILVEMIAGKGSNFYNNLYEKGLINASFSADYELGRGYSFCIFGGESREPKKVFDELLKEIDALGKSGFTQEEFERARKTVYGRELTTLNSPDRIANLLVFCYFMNSSFFSLYEGFEDVTLRSVSDLFMQIFNKEHISFSQILPQ